MTIAHSSVQRVNLLTSEIDAAYHDAALRLGLTDSALLILYAVCSRGESCMLSDIMRMSGVSKQTANSALRKLEADGIIYLESSGGRRKNVCLTDNGKRLAERTVLPLIAIENEVFDSWSADERNTYLALMQRYLTDFKEKIKRL